MAPLAQRATAADMGQHAPEWLDVWIYLNLVANTILLPILVATFLFSKRAKRHLTLVNVCTTWILSGIFSLLLFYAGHERGPEPPKSLCIAQTTLLYGITPMFSVAVLVLFIDMTNLFMTNPRAPLSKFKVFLMLSAPYVVQIAFSISTLILALQHPQRVTRRLRFFYCALKWHDLAMAMTLFVAIIGLAITILMIYLSILLYRNWHGFRHAGRPSHVHGQLILRVFIFGGYIIFGLVVNLISMLAPHNLAPDMYFMTIGTVLFLVFGTQKDVIRTWCFWLKEPAPASPIGYLPREPSWRESLDLTKSAVLPEEDFAHKQEKNKTELEGQWDRVEREKQEREVAWSEIARPPTSVLRG
ncbi:hypothetical protein R3P38DRAFT_2869083 [Favolaschia claudopus]|uniref:Uncharacterized protein n=1 Tax=Favolaschia claudopus TaxID=2862362 RepID=A0AAW0DCM8_9AGAR